MELLTPTNQMQKILLIITLLSAGTVFAGDRCLPRNTQEFWESYRWNSLDADYSIRQAQILSEIINREYRTRQLDQFLLDQGY